MCDEPPGRHGSLHALGFGFDGRASLEVVRESAAAVPVKRSEI
jgi:hypothetical protein